jgi:hypothetical protein
MREDGMFYCRASPNGLVGGLVVGVALVGSAAKLRRGRTLRHGAGADA